MNRQHTPGPWTLGESWISDDHIAIDAPSHGELASVVISMEDANPGEQFQELEANARLIAAAPELLEALDMLLRATVDDDLSHGITLTEAEQEARDIALAAIAKTTGTDK